MTGSRVLMRAMRSIETAGKFIRRFGGRRGLAAYASIAIAKRRRDAGAIIILDLPHSPTGFRIRTADADAHAFWQVFIAGDYDLPIPFEPSVIVDAGAHVGCSAVYFARRFTEARIVAIEPAAENVALLRSNVAGIARISVIHGALWSEAGQLSIANPHAPSWSFRMTRAAAGTAGIAAITMPALIAEFGVIDILKLDIEGAEGELFQGSTAWLDHVRMIILELHERYAPGCTALVHSAMRAHGFVQRSGRGENVVFVNSART